ncbi:MAG: MAPEG family protein [Devosiaceae bacterium]|nr:MAPEG family protein [Devosiaceae bacterium]
MMSIELWMLTAVAALQFTIVVTHGVHIFFTSGMWWGIGRRNTTRTVSDLGRRIERTLINNMEGLAIFVPLVLVVQLASISSPITQFAVQAYVILRIIFALLYITNIPYIRTFVWIGGQACLAALAFAIITTAV